MPDYSGSYATPRLDLGAAFWEYRRDGFRGAGLQMLATRDVSRSAGNFPKITREGILRVEAGGGKRGPGGNYDRVTWTAEDDSYATVDYGFEGVLKDDHRRNYSNDFDAEMATVNIVTRKVLMEQEIRIAAALFNTTTFTGATLFTDNSGAPWTTAATDIIGQILDALEVARKNTGIKPDTLLVSEVNLVRMLKNTGIKNQFPGADLITRQMIENALPNIFGIDRLVVGGEVKNTAAEGATAVVADIWSASYVMLAVTARENDPFETPCVGRSMLWTEDSPDNAVVEQYREEQSRGDVFRVRHNVDEKVIDPNFAHLMQVV